ncbi:MAG: twin-arginine translocase TatA/TatE family subunit [Actinomycetota bacterium]
MNISPGEIILIAIFALILFGPKKLPEIGRQVGRAIAEVRRVSRDFEREVRDAVEPFETEVRKTERLARDRYKLDENFSSYVNTPWPADKPPAAKTEAKDEPAELPPPPQPPQPPQE